MANAAVAGMTKDLELHIKGRYNIAIMIFFIPVCSPSNSLDKINKIKSLFDYIAWIC
jgi:hypothetical protein